MARRIEALNGSYGVTRRRDGKQGSLFWFTVPYRPDKAHRRGSVSRATPHPTRNLSSSTLGSALTAAVGGAAGSITTTVISPRNALTRLNDESNSNSVRLPPISPSSAAHSSSAAAALTVLPTIAGSPSSTPPGSTGNGESGNNTASSIAPLISSAPAPEKLNILVVDDALSILKMSSMMLRRQGHIITTAENGVEALDRMAEQLQLQQEQMAESGKDSADEPTCCFDVILMDLQMPSKFHLSISSTSVLTSIPYSHGRTGGDSSDTRR